MSDTLNELSKSSLFTVTHDTVVVAEPASQQNLDLTDKIIDNKYQILRPIGAGGMGCVYLARHLMLNKEVALKTFMSSNLVQEASLRFAREAKAIARLNHPNIIQVFDFGHIDGRVPYYTMEYLMGESLGQRLEKEKYLSIEAALAIFAQVFDGLSSAHKKNIIHRDMKPDNIFLEVPATGSSAPIAKVVDFGIASLALPTEEQQRLTRIGAIFGSPLYMSPEQSLGLEVTAKSDIYSCGCALMLTLTGEAPFLGNNAFSTLLMHQSAPAPTLRMASGGREFPPELEAIVARMLAKDPGDRFQSMDELLEKLQNLAGGPTSLAMEVASGPTNARANPDENTVTQARRPARNRTPIIFVIVLMAAAMAWLPFRGQLPQYRAAKPESIPKPTAHREILSTYERFPSLDLSVHQPIPPEELTRRLAKPNDAHLLKFGNKKLTAEQLEQISNCHWIQTISLNNCEVDNPSLGKLAKLKLTDINLSESNLDDRGAAKLSACRDLTDINLGPSNITDAGVKSMASIAGLQRVSLADCSLTDKSVGYLVNCKHIGLLDLRNNRAISNVSAARLQHMHLWWLTMAGTGIDDTGLMLLSHINNIRRLDVSRTAVTYEGARHFCLANRHVEDLVVDECPNLDHAKVLKLQSQFPSISFGHRTVPE